MAKILRLPRKIQVGQACREAEKAKRQAENASREAGSIDLSSVEVLVVDQAQLIENLTGLAEIERVFEYLPSGRQRILTSLPVTAGVQDLLDRHFKRTITIPTPETGVPKRGQVRFRIAPEPTEAAALSIVDELISGGARHVLVFCRSWQSFGLHCLASERCGRACWSGFGL